MIIITANDTSDVREQDDASRHQSSVSGGKTTKRPSTGNGFSSMLKS